MPSLLRIPILFAYAAGLAGCAHTERAEYELAAKSRIDDAMLARCKAHGLVRFREKVPGIFSTPAPFIEDLVKDLDKRPIQCTYWVTGREPRILALTFRQQSAQVSREMTYYYDPDTGKPLPDRKPNWMRDLGIFQNANFNPTITRRYDALAGKDWKKASAKHSAPLDPADFVFTQGAVTKSHVR